MTLNYIMIVAREYPKPNEAVGGSIPGREMFSLLDRKMSQVAMRILCSKNKFKKKNTKITSN